MANVIRSLRSLTPSLEDADLVLAARTGEAWAREALFRRHVGTVHGLAFRLLGPHAGSRDAVERAFVEAFRTLPELGDPAALLPWLLRVSVGVVRTRLARRLRFGRSARFARPDFAGLRSQLVFSGSAEQRGEVVAFYECLESLSREARLAVLLHELESMNAQDAAYCLQTPAASVRRTLARAERALAKFGGARRAPSLLKASRDELPVPLSEFERAQLYRRVEAGLALKAQPAWLSRAVWLAAVLALGAGLVLGFSAERLRRAPVALLTRAPDAAPRILELPDGSRASLSAAAELRVDAAEPSRVRLTLVAGSADFAIRSESNAEFVIQAGDTEIKALGRALSVAIADDAAKLGDKPKKSLEVHATDGPVDVQRAAYDGVITLGTGESWTGQLPTNG